MLGVLKSALSSVGVVQATIAALVNPSYNGGWGFIAGKPACTTAAVEGTDTYIGGFRFTKTGILRVYDATLGIPANTRWVSGVAVTADDQVCICKPPISNAWSPAPTVFWDFSQRSLVSQIGGIALTPARASVAWERNPDNRVWRSVANNVPRFHLANDNRIRLMIEDTRTNILAASSERDLTHVAWNTKTNITILKDQLGADDTINGASSILATADGAIIGQAIVSASAFRCFSALVKRLAGTGSLEISTDGGTTWKNVTADVVTNEYTQIWISSSTAFANPDVRFRIGKAGDKFAVDLCLSELNATTVVVPGTPISPVGTRAVESVSINPLGAWFNAVKGTVTVRARTHRLDPTIDTVIRRIYTFSDGTGNNIISVQRQPSLGSFNTPVTTGGVAQQAGFTKTGVVAQTVYQNTLAWANNRLRTSYDGDAFRSDDVVTVPVVNRLYVGANQIGTGNIWMGGLDFLAYWDTDLADAQVQRFASQLEPATYYQNGAGLTLDGRVFMDLAA